MGCINWAKFRLDHHDTDRFHRSEWDDPGVHSWGYLLYRLVLACLMVAGVLWHISLSTNTAKWFIYMTDQGITLLTLHYTLYALLALWAKICPPPSNGRTLPFLYKISWAMENMATTVAVFISLIYWTMLHETVVEFEFLKTPTDKFLNFFIHGLNSVSCIVDLFVNARPKRIHHFYFAAIFGLWYGAFSFTYWAAGGLSRCSVRCRTPFLNDTTTLAPLPPLDTVVRHGMCEEVPCDVIVCDDYIYPITDWSCYPGQAVAIALGGNLGIPLVQAGWWILYKLRMWISRRWGSARFTKDSGERSKESGSSHF